MTNRCCLAVPLLIGSISAAPLVRAEEMAEREAAPAHSSFSLLLVNDNPFLNLIPAFETEDDERYTYGMALAYSCIVTEGIFSPNERWAVGLRTDLYTRDMTPPGEDLFPNVPQKFLEVSSLKLSWDNAFTSLDSKRPYLAVSIGVGLLNDKDDSGVLAAAQQQAWHEFKHDNLTPDTTPLYQNERGDTHDYFPVVGLAVGKILTFGDLMRTRHREADRLKVEAGVECNGVAKGSYCYALADLSKPFASFGRSSFELDASLRATLYETADANTREYAGISWIRPQFLIRTGMTYVTGHQNVHFFRHTDSDPIWTMLIEWPLSGRN